MKFVNGRSINTMKKEELWSLFVEAYNIDPVDSFLNRRKEIREAKEKSKLPDQKNNKQSGFVYFVINEKHEFCKIGYSIDPQKRLKGIQTGCPFPVFIKKVIGGTPSLEKKFHKHFQRQRSSGEWFYIRGELKDFLYSDDIIFHFKAKNS